MDSLPSKEITGTKNAMDRYLESLSVENRVIFIRRYWFCDSYAEIASRYGIRERKVKWLLYETRAQMSAYFKKPWSTIEINHIDVRVIRESETISTLKPRKNFQVLFQSMRNNSFDHMLKRFLSFPKHA